MWLILDLLVLLPWLLPAQTSADTTGGAMEWRLASEQGVAEIGTLPESAARDTVLVRLQRAGHYFARIDSVRRDTVAARGMVYATAGRRYLLQEIQLEGIARLDEGAVRRQMDTREGQALDPEVLERDLERILRLFERSGHLLASAQVSSVELVEGSDTGIRLRIAVSEGPAPPLERVDVAGDVRTRSSYLTRVAGLRPGRPLRNYRPEELRARLEATGFYQSIGEPQIHVTPDSSVVLVFPLEERPPGTFDLVLGFLPPTRGAERISVVGNGHLELNNLFGGGRILALRLDRLPDQASSAEVRVSDPFILGLPLSLEAQFDGLQQDSAYTKQRYGLEVGVRLALATQGFVTLGREVTRPGVAAASGVSRADAWFVGVGARVRRVDHPLIPTRGYRLEVVAESGRKSHSGTTPAAPAIEATTTEQERVRLQARWYHPVRPRQILALGLDAASVLSGVGDESDLLRFGGATTLRGYDEDRFLARTAGRGLVEYRYLLDRLSFAFAFVDLGYVVTPTVAGVEAQRGFYPGYGIGMRFTTGVGVVSASYAISSEAGPTNGRIHVGLSFGL